jgi:hypothetical protein
MQLIAPDYPRGAASYDDRDLDLDVNRSFVFYNKLMEVGGYVAPEPKAERSNGRSTDQSYSRYLTISR